MKPPLQIELRYQYRNLQVHEVQGAARRESKILAWNIPPVLFVYWMLGVLQLKRDWLELTNSLLCTCILVEVDVLQTCRLSDLPMQSSRIINRSITNVNNEVTNLAEKVVLQDISQEATRNFNWNSLV
jgi:hypothetical protein